MEILQLDQLAIRRTHLPSPQVASEWAEIYRRAAAKRFLYDGHGNVMGIDTGIPLFASAGKTELIRRLRGGGALPGTAVMIGDGMTDLQPYLDGAVEEFIGFGAHRVRDAVRRASPRYALSTEELRSFLSPFLSP